MDMNNVNIEEIVKQVLSGMTGNAPAQTAAPAAQTPAAPAIPKTARVAMMTEKKHFELQEYSLPEVGDDDILVARLRQIINFNVLGQIFDHLNGVVAQGVEPRLREVPLRIPGRDGPDDEAEQNDQHQHQRRDRCGIDSAAEDFTGCFAFLPLVPIQFHTVFLLSVPAALLDALRREEQEHSRHGQVIDQRRKGETVVDEILKGGKKA